MHTHRHIHTKSSKAKSFIIQLMTESEVLQGCYESNLINHIKEL